MKLMGFPKRHWETQMGLQRSKVLQRYCKGMTNSYVEEPRKPVSQKRVGLKILGIGDNSFMQYK